MELFHPTCSVGFLAHLVVATVFVARSFTASLDLSTEHFFFGLQRGQRGGVLWLCLSLGQIM